MDVKRDNIAVGFLGAGKMAQALAKGFISAGLVKAENLRASATRSAPNLCVFKDYGAYCSQDNCDIVKRSNIVIISVKPHIVPNLLKEVSSVVTKDHLIVSIASGIQIEAMERLLPEGTRIIRVAPNTPSLVKCGASAYSVGRHTTEDDNCLVERLLSSVGICEKLPEKLLDTVTALAGSGAAFMYVAIEALSDGGVKMGLPRDVSTRLAAQTVMGAGKMALVTGQHPGQLKDAVTSPGGTTIAGIHELERSGYRGALITAVETATNKSKQLGSQKH